MKMPKGFTAHDGKGCPIDPLSYMEALVRTSEGYGSTGVQRADNHDWAHADGIGAIVGYRKAAKDEEAIFDRFARHQIASKLPRKANA